MAPPSTVHTDTSRPRSARAAWLLLCVATLLADGVAAAAYRALFPPVDHRRLERAYRRSSEVYHHGLAPNVDTMGAWGDRRFALRTNSLGFKDRSRRTVALASSGRRLLFIGDSFTEGVGYPFESTFVGRIGAALAPSGVEVLNAAAVSYAPSIYYRKVKHLIENVGLRFDELVVFLDLSDVWDEAMVYRLDERENVVASAELPPLWLGDVPDEPAATRLRRWIVAHSILARFVDTVFRTGWRARADACAGLDGTPLAAVTGVDRVLWTLDPARFRRYGAEGLARAQAHMTRLAALLARHDRTMTIVVYPWPDQIVAHDRESLQVTRWREWAARHDVRAIDLFRYLVDVDAPAAVVARYFIPCDVHFNAEGHRLIADAFLREYARTDTSTSD